MGIFFEQGEAFADLEDALPVYKQRAVLDDYGVFRVSASARTASQGN
jgi:hypothetical protein